MRLRPLLHAALPVLAFVASAAWLLGRTEVAPGLSGFHVDEAHKIAESRFFQLFFVERDFDHPAWSTDFYARTNPPVGKYVFGAALAASGRPVRDAALQEAFDRDWRRPGALRAEVDDAQLRTVRAVSALCAALSVALVLVAARAAGGTAAGLAAAALLLANGRFLDAARLGMTDTLLLASLALVVPVTLGAWRALERRRGAAWLAVLAPGAAIAFATGVKLNGALSGVVFGASLLLLAASSPPERRRRRVLAALLVVTLAGALALALFVAINPWLWASPLARLWSVWLAYGDWTRGLQIDPGPPLLGLEQRGLTALYDAFQSPQLLAVRWLGAAGSFLLAAVFVHGLITLAARARRAASDAQGEATAEAEPGAEGEATAEAEPGAEGEATAGAEPGAEGEATAEAEPGAEGEATASRGDEARRGAAGVVVLVFAWVLLLGMGLWAPLDWERYSLPPCLGIAVVTGVGLAAAPAGLAALARAARARGIGGAAPAALAACLAAGAAAALLPGAAGRALRSPSQQAAPPEAYRAALARRPDEALLWRQLGLAQLRAGRAAEAVASFEAATRRLPPPRVGEPDPAAVLRAILAFDRALAELRAGRPAAARRSLAVHETLLAGLRDSARSGDPDVREHFDRIARERRAWLEAAAAPAGATHGAGGPGG